MGTQTDRVSLVMSANRALLGEVSCSMRSVLIKSDAKAIYVKAMFDGPVSDDDRESISLVGTHVAADFDGFRVFDDCVRIDRPEAIPPDISWTLVFLRKE
jgi:hypothetical protein